MGGCHHEDGWTALHAAAVFNHPEIVGLLLQAGAAVDPRSDDGFTPLLNAARPEAPVVTALLNAGADRPHSWMRPKVRAMPHIDGEALRAWRRSRGWDVPETARRLRRAAVDDQMPVHDALVRMIWRWERLGLKTERYELQYRALGFDDAQASRPEAARHESGGDLDAADEASDVMAWITGTNTTDDTIAEMARAAS
jgi:Ankyrin repeats (3 copies)